MRVSLSVPQAGRQTDITYTMFQMEARPRARVGWGHVNSKVPSPLSRGTNETTSVSFSSAEMHLYGKYDFGEGGPKLKKGLRELFGIGVRVLHANFGPKRFSRGFGIVTTHAHR